MKEVKTFEVNSNLGWWANFIKALIKVTFGVVCIFLYAIPVRGLSAYGYLSHIIKNGSIDILIGLFFIFVVATTWLLFIEGCVSLLLCMRENKNKYTFEQYSNASIVCHIVVDSIFIIVFVLLSIGLHSRDMTVWVICLLCVPASLESLCSFLFDALFVKYNWEKIYKTQKK